MPDETIELTQVQAVLGGLSSPTDEQFVQAVRAYSDGAVASAAAKLALAGGGGGGSLPAWWTVDSTPGSEKLTLNGSLLLLGPEGAPDAANYFDVGTFDGESELIINKDAGLRYWAGGDQVFTIGPTGAVTISPSDAPGAFNLLADGTIEMLLATFGGVAAGAGDAGLTLFAPTDGYYLKTDDDEFTVSSTGAVTISPGASETLKVDEDQIGFFGHATAVQPAAPADVNDVIAGLQALGLFAT